MRTLAPLRAVCLAVAFFWPLAALSRTGGGEHFETDFPDPGGDGSEPGETAFFLRLVLLAFRYPEVGVPVLLVAGAIYLWAKRSSPKAQTQAAFRDREAQLRTRVSNDDVRGWVNRLRLKDPAFELQVLLERTATLFLAVQDAWFRRDLSAVRPYLSDATFQRLRIQLRLMELQGVRDALVDIQVLEVQLIGVESSEWFDTVQLRIRAQARDKDVPARWTDDEARTAARQAPLEPFTEVWTFMRKPGATTRIGNDVFHGKCPNCGAPYRGGATNVCEYCQAVVNSGNYDWTLSEITQGTEHLRHFARVDGLREARLEDPALNLEMVEDRAALIFWKWVEAQTHEEPEKLAKLGVSGFVEQMRAEAESLRQRGRRKVYLDCTVGAVTVKLFRTGDDDFNEAHVDIRWSARMGIGPRDEKPPELPTVPQRWVLTLGRKKGAQTPIEHGLSTARCTRCHGPLTDSLSVTCDYCGERLAESCSDWILQSAYPYETWNVREEQRFLAAQVRRNLGEVDDLLDIQERERLLYMMAALAAADGEVSPKERQLLEMCAERWSVDFERVKLALTAGPQVFERLIPKSSPEASSFLKQLVNMALIDGRIDNKERRLLEATARHLGLANELTNLIGGRQGHLPGR
jgi:tellurite resistance protein